MLNFPTAAGYVAAYESIGRENQVETVCFDHVLDRLKEIDFGIEHILICVENRSQKSKSFSYESRFRFSTPCVISRGPESPGCCGWCRCDSSDSGPWRFQHRTEFAHSVSEI